MSDWRETYKRHINYEKNNVFRISLKLNKTTDADIIAAIESSPNKNGFMKTAIRAYIESKENKE